MQFRCYRLSEAGWRTAAVLVRAGSHTPCTPLRVVHVRILRPDTPGGDTLKQVEEEYPSAGRGAARVKDVGRLLLRCADRPGLVAAVSAFLAGAGANIVSLDQHATEQSGGTFMQRTIFNLPGLTAARDALERDFR
ncbi:MAG: formyltetrahydrofolate deformylase, partial [Mycobacterium sp.]|nr:formyltetrahydrofolate deformylase [Mycobacterium sp.]